MKAEKQQYLVIRYLVVALYLFVSACAVSVPCYRQRQAYKDMRKPTSLNVMLADLFAYLSLWSFIATIQNHGWYCDMYQYLEKCFVLGARHKEQSLTGHCRVMWMDQQTSQVAVC